MSKDLHGVERYPPANINSTTSSKVNINPERVKSSNTIELFKNGATSKKSLPKNPLKKCNRTSARGVY
jgi:hypothetical protein